MLPRPSLTPLRRSVLPAAILALTAAALAHAQNEVPPAPGLYTLHVYNNLVQFPTVVLGPDLKPLPPIPREKFAITLDAGPVFHPTQMRREGDDPISLALVLDASGNQRYTVENFAEPFAQLAPAFLHRNDHVSVYAADCTLMRSLHDEPADPAVLRKAIAEALAAPRLHGEKARPACGHSLRLWDFLTVAAKDLADQPGRRVILLVSQGADAKSATPLTDATLYVAGRGIAVFGLRDTDEWVYSDRSTSTSMHTQGLNISIANPRNEDYLSALCARSGGMVLYAQHRLLARQLQDFIALLRNRYIIEFPRPDEFTPARHDIAITTPGIDAFVRSTGASTPLPDPAILNDPTTLRSPSSPAILGPHHPAAPKH